MRDFEAKLAHCAFLDPSTNPVLCGHCDLKLALAQYAALPLEIAGMLLLAAQRTSDWPAVSAELMLNREEELGSETEGIPHVEILAHGLRRELGMSLSDTARTDETTSFIEALRAFLASKSVAEVAGAVFALEHSAIPELKVLGCIISSAKQQQGIEVHQSAETAAVLQMPLSEFIRMHTEGFEVLHRDRLWTATSQYLIDDKTQLAFCSGFDFVLSAMELWWNSIAAFAEQKTQ